MKKQLDDIQIKNNQLLFDIQKATDTADRMEGERNSNKQKAKALKQDMSKIFRACGGKSIDDVEALVRERRELQVHVKIHQAERDGEIFLSLLCPIVFSLFDRPLTYKSFFNIVYFSLISLKEYKTN